MNDDDDDAMYDLNSSRWRRNGPEKERMESQFTKLTEGTNYCKGGDEEKAPSTSSSSSSIDSSYPCGSN